MIKEMSKDLVQRWKDLYRTEKGAPASAPSAIGTQRLRTTAMFLEESCYTHVQKAVPYRALMEGVAEKVKDDPQLARELAIGGISAVEFVKKVAEERKRAEVHRMNAIMK